MRNWNDESPTLSKSSTKTDPEQISSSAAMASQPATNPQVGVNVPAVAEWPESKVPSSASTDLANAAPFDQAATKKLLWKLDLHLIPFLALIYLLCYLDRTNIGNARLASLEVDLKMKGLDYNIALAIFFPFYVAAEIPSNLMMKRIRPSIWLTIIMVSWGLIMTCMGLVHNFQGLLACRVFLGIAEGGLFPGVAFFITMWYRRQECGFRLAVFFSAATAAGAFGGLFARGISEMAGVGDKAGWSWIFILEGLLTLVIGSTSYWAINDYPATAKFLTPTERVEVQRRLNDDNGLSDDFDLKYLGHAVRDWKIWVNMFMSIGIITALYSISVFLPTILKDMGYSTNQSQLMTVPPYVLACIMTIGVNYIADRCNQRGVFLLACQVVAIAGWTLLISSNHAPTKYGGIFLATSGIFPIVPLVIVWNSNNIGGSVKRGVGIAMQVGFGNLGGVVASFVYLPKDAPNFRQGHAILLGLISFSFVLTSFMTLYLRRENARRDEVLRQREISIDDFSDEMKWQEREKGDNAVFYRYTV